MGDIWYTGPMTSNDLLTRGVAKVIPQKLAEEKLASGKKMRLYLGIDPTGSKLHLGHSVPLRKLNAFAQAGHEVIFLIGSYTAMIGDPSGKDTMREPLTREQVEENFAEYKEQASKILDFSTISIRHNHEWLDSLTLKNLMGLMSAFTIQQMMQRDMFERRLEENKPIGMHEFLYPIMVGYDSVMLDVDGEIGGTDQEFNMLCGRALQKECGKREKFVLTCKLIEGTDGRKMSKTYDNCIYLTDSPNEMYGKTMTIRDDLILSYMECCTDIPLEEIHSIDAAMKKGENPKEFKMRLARELVSIYHGSKAAMEAEQEFTNIFTKKGVPEVMQEIRFTDGELLVDLLVRTGTLPSKSEARRLLAQHAISLDGTEITNAATKAEPGVLKIGKRIFVNIVAA